jgi:hypothetical protein
MDIRAGGKWNIPENMGSTLLVSTVTYSWGRALRAPSSASAGIPGTGRTLAAATTAASPNVKWYASTGKSALATSIEQAHEPSERARACCGDVREPEELRSLASGHGPAEHGPTDPLEGAHAHRHEATPNRQDDQRWRNGEPTRPRLARSMLTRATGRQPKWSESKPAAAAPPAPSRTPPTI